MVLANPTHFPCPAIPLLQPLIEHNTGPVVLGTTATFSCRFWIRASVRSSRPGLSMAAGIRNELGHFLGRPKVSGWNSSTFSQCSW